MRKHFWSILSVALCLLLAGLLPCAAHAEDAPRYEDGVVYAYINPDYAGVFRAEDLDQPPEVRLKDTVPTITTVEELSAYYREMMVARRTVFQFYCADSELASVNLSSNFNLLIPHNGDPKEGDYLRGQCPGFTLRRQDELMTITMTFFTTAAQEAELDRRLDSVMASLNLVGKTEYQKLEAIYSYICSHVRYDSDNSSSGDKLRFSAYAGLVQGKCTCNGFATLFYRMALEAGLKARYITGDTSSGKHAWNIAAIEGLYYDLDATWDAGKSSYSWFLRGTYDFPNHTRKGDYSTKAFMANHPMADQAYGSAQPAPTPTPPCLTGTDYPETAHPYTGRLDQTWIYRVPGAECLRVTFSQQTDLYKSDDFRLYSAGFEDVCNPAYGYLNHWLNDDGACFLSGATLTIPGDTLIITLTSSGKRPGDTKDYYGFSIDSIVPLDNKPTPTPTPTPTPSPTPTPTPIPFEGPVYPESLHDYLPNTDQTWRYCLPGATSLIIHFSFDCSLADGYDYITLRDGNQTLVGRYTGSELSRAKITVPGDTVFITLTTVDAYQCYGFSIDNIRDGGSITDQAEFDYEIDEYDEDEVNITGYHGTAETVAVPETIDGYTVTGIAYGAFANNGYLRSVTFPGSLTTISGYAFENCENLENVIIPGSVFYIGDGAFTSCPKLESVFVVESSEYYTSVDGCLLNKSETSLRFVPQSKTKYEVPSTVDMIWFGAFSGSNLQSVTIPAKVDYLERYCFEGCTSLREINVSADNPYYRFENGALLSKDGTDLIYVLETTKDYTIPEGVTNIDSGAFAGNSITDIIIPDTVTRFGASVFRDCKGLRTIQIPEGVKSLENAMFKGCTNLTAVLIPDSVTDISERAFDLPNSNVTIYAPLNSAGHRYAKEHGINYQVLQGIILPDMVLPDSLTTIEAEAFAGGSFSAVRCPDGLQTIGSRAFADCPALVQVEVPSSVVSIAPDAFENSPYVVLVYTQSSPAAEYAEAMGFHVLIREDVE